MESGAGECVREAGLPAHPSIQRAHGVHKAFTQSEGYARVLSAEGSHADTVSVPRAA